MRFGTKISCFLFSEKCDKLQRSLCKNYQAPLISGLSIISLFLQKYINPIYPMINPKDLLIIYGISGLS